MRVLFRRLRYLLRRSSFEADLADEMAFHREMKEREFAEQGRSSADAATEARRAFGSGALAQNRSRDIWLWPWLEGLLYDLRFAWRALRRDRTFTLAAVAMLAIAIGLNASVYTIMDAMLFRGFPLVDRNDRLVYLQERPPSGICCISYADFEDWRAGARTFEGMAFLASNRPITFRDGDGRPSDMLAFRISANTFGLLGVPPLMGRDFVPADEAPGAPQVAILNYRFWEIRFAKRADIVGSSVYINSAPATIIGVMPEGFDFPTRENLWLPIVRTTDLLQRGFTPGGFTVVGRLRNHVTREAALAELEAINRRLEAAYPATNRGVVPTLATHAETVSGGDAPLIWGSLWGAAWFVLLVACANVANLTLARTTGRWRDFSTRMALGAGQGRMVRQLFVEGFVLAGIAGAVGLWLTTWSIRTWAAVTISRYQVLDYTVNGGTFAYLTAISVAAAVLFSLPPVVTVAKLGLSGRFGADTRGTTGGPRGKRLSGALVAVQMMLAIVLLSGSGVLVRSLAAIVGAESGVRDPERVLVGSMRLPSDKYPSPETRQTFYERLDARLKELPGIEEQAVAATIPVSWVPPRALAIEGRSASQESEQLVAVLTAGSDYFRVVGVSPSAGRGFTDSDRAGALPVAIVNQSFAARFWPGEQPLGKRLRTTTRNAGGEWRTVVGIVPNILQGDPLRQEFKPVVYVPFQQEPAPRFAFFLLRTGMPSSQLAQIVRAELQSLDADVAVEDVETLKASFAFDRDFMDAEHSELGKHATVAPVFALIALVLAAIGLSAVLAHGVSQRTREIGVRMAIGATAADLRRMVLREGMTPAGLGLVLGLAASFAVNRVLQSQLVGVSPYDPVTLAVAPLALIIVSLAACQIPAKRAMAVDPVVALKQE